MKQKIVLLSALLFAAVLIALSPVFAEDVTPYALVQKAEAMGGSLRVIVRLKMDYVPEAELASAAAVDAQQANIRTAQNDLLAILGSDGVDNVRTFTTIPFMAMSVNTDVLQSLLQNENVLSVEEDIPVPPSLRESIPFINANDAHRKRIKKNGVTSRIKGKGITVAILDTGVRKTHQFLDSGKVVSEACYSTNNSYYGSTTLCPNGRKSQVGPGAGVNCYRYLNGCSHGTHVAGIAAGTGGPPGVGVAPEAKVIAIQVFSKFNNASICGSSNPCVLSYTSDQIAGLERVYALRKKYTIAAANMSLGGGQYGGYCNNSAMKSVIDNLRTVGIATVIASGNNGYNGYVNAPGCISSAVTVGATHDNSNTVSYYSNHSHIVDLMAPGSNITSSVAISNTAYESYNGTSMATPHVTGAFALLKQRYPGWSVNKIETWLKNHGKPVSRAGITKPRIDLYDISSFPEAVNIAPIQLLLSDS